MQEILQRCAGIDIHKKSAVVCIMTNNGEHVNKQIKTYSTMTEDLRALGSWLIENDVQQVAIESTGVYWIPVYNILEVELGLKIVLANARHIKNVPGRKTDVKDCEWLCRLLKNGLIRPSFIPPADVRNLRRLTRLRIDIIGDLTAVKNRIIKLLESCNVKLASVLSSVFCGVGRKVLSALLAHELDPERLANLVDHGAVKATKKDLVLALTGTIQEHDISMLRLLVKHLESLEQFIVNIDQEISKHSAHFSTEIKLLDEIPGISLTSAISIVSEIGINMDQFPTENHLASWVGVAPGNNESAGKKKSSRIGHGNSYLKPLLVQLANAAVKVKSSYFYTYYRRLKARMGSKKAIIAAAHRLMICIYWVIMRKSRYYDLGADYTDKNAKDKKIKYHMKKLQELGFNLPDEMQSSSVVSI